MKVIETPNKVERSEWNLVHISNNDHQAVVQLNNDVPSIRHHHPRPLPEGVNKPVFIGGKNEDRRPDDGFIGVISSVAVSGDNLPLGEATRPDSVTEYDACALNYCLNDAKCRASNNQKGYICECRDGFTGDQCQNRPHTCREENCNAGICLENEETWQCVCPVGTTGLRCEEKEEPREALGFSFDTSFIALPKPKKFESVRSSHFSRVILTKGS
ncbi:unnamed protein product [Caenorhabditis auriculariae]|uniref:EGF-like domain-containing protein n=1 Tax=Caenorhabditis auriculariae TaxID=2777116 RepID=A0A8S1HM18_9PELO|nr:unnamed protein product [Caenorhabditis auriculariae]